MTIDAEIPENANGVLYALGGFSGGLSLYVKDGTLSYEYNLFELMRTHIRAKERLSPGKAKIEVETSYVEPKPAGPLKVVIRVDGKEVASGVVPVSAPLLVHRQRLPGYRRRPGVTGLGRLLRPGAVQVRRQDRKRSREVRQIALSRSSKRVRVTLTWVMPTLIWMRPWVSASTGSNEAKRSSTR